MAKIATDINQSKQLAKILPIESADMLWGYYYNGKNYCVPNIRPFRDMHDNIPKGYTPAWSLATLIDMLPQPAVDDDGNEYDLVPCKEDDVNYSILYRDVFTGELCDELEASGDELVDVCVEMILKLHELNLL